MFCIDNVSLCPNILLYHRQTCQRQVTFYFLLKLIYESYKRQRRREKKIIPVAEHTDDVNLSR